ncbi:MAG: rane protein [Paenibacillaceae bacterium]|jgi:two-component system sensor histidine kinase YesM|nr:rane protein [Paenibacillaceae bacterium]
MLRQWYTMVFPWKRKFSTKLFFSHLLLCIVPVLILTHVFYSQSKQQIQGAATDFLQMFTSQVSVSFNSYMSHLENISRTIYNDYDMIAFLGKEASYGPTEQIRYHLIINRQLSQFMTELPSLQGAAVLSESGLVYNNGYMPDVTSYKGQWEEWLEQIRKANGKFVVLPAHNQIYLNSGTVANVFSAGRLIQDIEGRRAGILLFQISPNKLIANDKNIDRVAQQYNTRLIVSLHADRLIYDSEQSPDFHPNAAIAHIDSRKHLLVKDDSSSLQVTLSVPYKELDKKLQIYRRLAIVIGAVVLAAITLFSMLLSYQITKPIHRMIMNMRHVEEGTYRPISSGGASIELELLTANYNNMIKEIKHMIEVVYEARIKQNEAKFLALQSQINPHWLYNTLESIRMKAHLSNSPEVALMVKYLGRMFQMALSSKKNNTVEDELEYVRVYLHLQNLRFDNRFELEERLPDNLLKLPVIPLIFQPVIENSIKHAFVDQTRKYSIVITGAMDQDTAIIRIEDNGRGMPEERLSHIQTLLLHTEVPDESSGSSLGLRNIQERLQLQYGKRYGLSIHSSSQGGTTIRIQIPKDKKEESDVQGPAGG